MKRMREGVAALVMALAVIAGQLPEAQAQAQVQDQTGDGILSLESGGGIVFESTSDGMVMAANATTGTSSIHPGTSSTVPEGDDETFTSSNANTASAVAADENDDAPGLTISPSRGLTIRENSSAVFTVRLNTEPSGNVRVYLRQPSDMDMKVDPYHMDFSPTNWNVPRRFTLTVANDHDAIDERTILVLEAAGSGYDDVARSLTIAVSDDDTAGLSIRPQRVVIDEGGSGRFTLSLHTEPSETVTVSMSQPSNADVRISLRSLTFTKANWNEPRTVTVGSIEDSDSSNDTANIVLTASGGDYEGYGETVPVTVIDKGGASRPLPSDFVFVISDPSITLNEGEGARFEVRLKTQPSGNVTVNLTLRDDGDVTLTSDTLIFTPLNWGTEQPVDLAAGEDEDFLNDLVRIDLKAFGGGYDTATGTLHVSVIDNDTFGSALILSSESLVLNEGESGTFTVRLSLRPGAEVNVVLSQPLNPDIKIDTDENLKGPQNTLIFTSQNWDIPQSVSVFAAADNDALEDRATVSLRASGGGYARIGSELSVSVIDDDPPPGLILFPSTDITVSEGDSGIFTVRLATQPSDGVTLTLIQPSNADIRVDTDPKREGFQNRLVFGRSNWDQVQAVIVSAANDRDNGDNRTGVSIVVAGAEEYSGIKVQPTVIAIESDPSLAWEARSVIPAIAPLSALDMTSIRVSCKDEGVECDIFLDCTAQDGTIYRGLMNPIPSMGARVLSTRDIVAVVGGDWSGKGRLLCSLRSEEIVSGQIWTRSGNGVLVNNTQSLRSAEVIDASGRTYHRVDIESIPSPDDSNLSNIRLRCEGGNDCTDVVFECYEDDGTLYSGVLGLIGRRHTRHLQTQDLSSMIGHHWQGMTLSCEVRSDHPFSVQVLTRTGGGGALVNNSATGVYRENMGVR